MRPGPARQSVLPSSGRRTAASLHRVTPSAALQAQRPRRADRYLSSSRESRFVVGVCVTPTVFTSWWNLDPLIRRSRSPRRAYSPPSAVVDSADRPVFHGPFGLPPHVPFSHGVPLIPLLLARANASSTLAQPCSLKYTCNGISVKPCSRVLPTSRRISSLCNNSLRVRVGSWLNRLPCEVRADVHVVQVHFAVFDAGECIVEICPSPAQRLDFRPGQHEAGFERFQYMIIVPGLAVGHHGPFPRHRNHLVPIKL